MKPADFFLGVVNFLGVLVPGAVLLILRVPLKAWTLDASPIPPWLLFGGVSYLAGQLLLAATERVNDTAEPLACLISPELRRDVDTFRDQASGQVELMKIGSRQAKFHTALSYLRTQKTEAAAEVDHHMADYKLLRNLLAVLLIDLTARVTLGSPILVLLLEAGAFMVCLLAFVRMFCWAELLAFQYVCLLTDKKG
ncbi:MAG TPA: hypothetical protein VIK60_11920 [Vicinamibacterales bacterium]